MWRYKTKEPHPLRTVSVTRGLAFNRVVIDSARDGVTWAFLRTIPLQAAILCSAISLVNNHCGIKVDIQGLQHVIPILSPKLGALWSVLDIFYFK